MPLPPPLDFGYRLATFAAATLVAVALVAPVAAQDHPGGSSVSSGRVGPTTCVGVAEIDAGNFPIMAMASNNSVTVTAREITWSQVLAPLSNGQAPTNALISVRVYSAADGTVSR